MSVPFFTRKFTGHYRRRVLKGVACTAAALLVMSLFIGTLHLLSQQFHQ
jgi:hypothetical protein